MHFESQKSSELMNDANARHAAYYLKKMCQADDIFAFESAEIIKQQSEDPISAISMVSLYGNKRKLF